MDQVWHGLEHVFVEQGLVAAFAGHARGFGQHDIGLKRIVQHLVEQHRVKQARGERQRGEIALDQFDRVRRPASPKL